MTSQSKEKNEIDENETEEVTSGIEEIHQPGSEEIVNLKSQITNLQEKLLRSVAEADNTRKRLEKLRDDTRDYAIVSFAKDLLSVSDNLARALEYRPENPDKETASIITGIEMTQSDFARVFKQHGIESIEPIIGSKFDYNIHSAISQIETNEYDNETIIAVMQVGYKIKDRLLRPATVQVTKKTE